MILQILREGYKVDWLKLSGALAQLLLLLNKKVAG